MTGISDRPATRCSRRSSRRPWPTRWPGPLPRPPRPPGRSRRVDRLRSTRETRDVHDRIPTLICPSDRVAIDPDGSDSFVCRTCLRRFPVESGVVRFLEDRDAFYEGRFQNTIRYRPLRDRTPWSWPLWLISSGYVWAVRRHVEAGGTVLELGCGSGIAYLSQRYRTIGIDLSFSSLARVADRYAAC